MSDEKITRRDLLAAGAVVGLSAVGQQSAEAAQKNKKSQGDNSEFNEFSRYRPSFGGPPGSDHYLGKLVPGLRSSGLPPVPVHSPDLKKLEFKQSGRLKEFHLHCQAVKQEFLPGRFMDVWGFNGSLPGPTIEAYQGDRVRIVVHNELPEPTSMHWHGFELPIEMDGVPALVQDLIPPGTSFSYEFDLHQTGTFFYHAHVAMQEAMGMCGLFIVHPKIAYDPPVDRDFALIYQNFFIMPNATIADTSLMDWNWHTINGRCGPYTTPMVAKLGERVRVRLMNFSPMQHHPIHFHGHTFWLTGTEGGRIPESAWIPRNNTLVGVAMVQDFEFIAFNPGDWIFHCHMVHHMMNHMTRQVGPRIRGMMNAMEYDQAMPNAPEPKNVLDGEPFKTPGYPQGMTGMMMSEEMSASSIAAYKGKRETRGMRKDWWKGVHGLMTVLRVLPEELYDLVMNSNRQVSDNEVFDAIVGGKYKKKE